MQVRLLDPVPSVARAPAQAGRRDGAAGRGPDQVLDSVSNSLRRGRYPERVEARKVAGLLRAFADNLDA